MDYNLVGKIVGFLDLKDGVAESFTNKSIIAFQVCKNGAFHLRGNLYVHYKSLDSAVMAYQAMNGRYFAGKQVFLILFQLNLSCTI